MEMSVLSELGRWLLDEPGLKERWGDTWTRAYAACGSPEEWNEFVREPRDPLVQLELRVQSERIAKEVVKRREVARRSPVPDLSGII